jgi:hypothetical protein
MLGFMILTVSDIKRSLAFYEAALKPLNIKFFLPYKGEDGHPDLWGFGDRKKAFFWLKQGSLIQQRFIGALWPKIKKRLMNSTRPHCPLVPETTFHREHGWNIIRDIMPPMYSTPTGIRSRSSTKARAVSLFLNPQSNPQFVWSCTTYA